MRKHFRMSQRDTSVIFIAFVSFVAITTCTLIFMKDPVKDIFNTVPLYISLVVMFLQTKASRYAYLLGGINCIIYTIVDVVFGLYASALQTIAISCPLQIATFINWRRNAYGKSTVFKKMKTRNLLLLCMGILAAYAVSFAGFNSLDSKYMIIDTFIMVLGFVTPVLTLLAYVDYVAFQLMSTIPSFILYLIMTIDHPERMAYFVYNIYGLICVVLSAIRVCSLYKEQKNYESRTLKLKREGGNDNGKGSI